MDRLHIWRLLGGEGVKSKLEYSYFYGHVVDLIEHEFSGKPVLQLR